MAKKPFVILILLFNFFAETLYAQNSNLVKQTQIIERFIEAYNRQDYPGMKKLFMPLAKLFSVKMALKNEFIPLFKNYGKVKILSIKSSSVKKCTAELSYENDCTEKDFLFFYFNKKNRIMGLNFKIPEFIYPKTNDIILHKNCTSKIDTLLKLKQKNGFSGYILVLNNGREIYKNGLGYANYNTKEKLNENSLFELASCSKQFTGMAIMILAEQGKLNYSDTLQKYISNMPYKNITIKNLLTHTSGLPDYMELLEKHWDKNKFATNYDVVNLFNQYKPKLHFHPNEKFEYSNTGYALLSVIIEKASGLTYADFLDKYIFKKLQMKQARVYNSRRSGAESINNYAYGYVFSKNKNRFIIPDSLPDYKFVIYMDAITGDGTVNASISDLALWENALKENTLLKKTTIEHAYSKHILKNGEEINYNFGQFICGSDTTEKLVYHGGSWPGYATFTLHFIDKALSIIILSNSEYNRVSHLADQLALILLNE